MANIVELRQMSPDKIGELLEDAREEMFNLRFQKAGMRLENNAQLRKVRREIAQLETVKHTRELAIAAAAAHPAIAAALSGRDYQANARFVYEESLYRVDFQTKDGKDIATAQVDLNKRQPKGRAARNAKKPQLVVSHEVRG